MWRILNGVFSRWTDLDDLLGKVLGHNFEAVGMLLVLLTPCISMISLRPFTSASLKPQQRFAIAVLLAFSLVFWFIVFGDEWTSGGSPSWESQFVWLVPIALAALAWYLALAWKHPSKQPES